ncbi:MAG: DUF1870 family protein [Jatrophihabitantaceae bacterium]
MPIKAAAATVSGAAADDTQPLGPMTDAELRVVRDFLGLTGAWLANHLGVEARTVRRWEAGISPIPDAVRVEMGRLEELAAASVELAIQQLNDARDAVILTYRDDEDLRLAHPEQLFPAAYHRAIVARVAHDVPGLTIRYVNGSSGA